MMKKLFLSILLLACAPVFGQQSQVNCGVGTPCTTTGPGNTSLGDPLWKSFGKLNANDAQLYGYNTHGREFSIYDYGAKCDGSTNDSLAVSSAEAAAASIGGGVVTGYGTCAISTALVFHDPRVLFSAKHYGDADHDTGSNDNGWTLKWTGTAGATMMTIAATTGASKQALYGPGIQGVTFDCNNSAGIGLQLGSVKGGTWNGVYFVECTTAALDMVPLTPLGEASDVQGNNFIGTRCNIKLSTGICIRLRGTATNNTSFDSFYSSQIVYKNGVGIQEQNSDNISFFNTQMFRAAAGTGIGVEITGDANGSARSNFFYDLSAGAGGVTVRGTETNPTAVQNVQFLGYDITNAPPAPVLGTGVTGITVYKENGHMSGAGMVNGFFGESDFGLGQAFTLCNSVDSICLYNGSSSGLRFLDGTGNWLIRQDGSHNLAFVRSAGTGNVTIPVLQAVNGVMSGGTLTVASGCGTTTSPLGGQTAGSFAAGSSTCNPVFTLPAFTGGHGWHCRADDITTAAASFHESAYTTSSATLTGTGVVNGDLIVFSCLGF